MWAPPQGAFTRHTYLYAVSRQSAAGDEVALSLAGGQELAVGHSEHLDDARQLVALVLAREQRVPGQQLHHYTPCNSVDIRLRPRRPGAAPGGSHLDRGSFTLGRGAGPQIVARPPNLAVLLTHFVGQLICKKTCKFDAIRRRILRLKCTKFDFRWGSAQTPLGNLQHSPDPVAVFKGAYF